MKRESRPTASAASTSLRRALTACASFALLFGMGIQASPTLAAGTPSYIAIDIGTLGGPNAAPSTPGRVIANDGTVLASEDTPALDPFPGDPGCISNPCHANHASQWRKGVVTDMGALNGYSSGVFELNGAGVGAGVSETGLLDPLTGAPETHAVISSGGTLHDLGTLGGNESWAMGINNMGEISGYASNTIPDPYAPGLSPFPSATQWHAAIWMNGKAQDLGTLGGPDSIGGLLNESGQVAGESFISATPNPSTGMPTMDPFLWTSGEMRDLGGFGGTVGFANWMNNLGEVVGVSNLAGDQAGHPFLWNGNRLIDLGTLGGKSGMAMWVNDAGTVVGRADIATAHVHHGFSWQNGTMRDLPPTGGAPCSNAFVVNDRGEAVGNDTDCRGHSLAAVLWSQGSAIDLNSVIGNFPEHLTESAYISNRGEIACLSTLPNGDTHIVLLVPASLAAVEGLSSNANQLRTLTGGSGPGRQPTRDLRDMPANARQLLESHLSK